MRCKYVRMTATSGPLLQTHGIVTKQAKYGRARGIPIANTPVRPSDPSDSDSDGAVILFNVDTGEEYDFWQAATINADSSLQGAGKIGEPIVRAGGVAYFRTDSLGTQLPICDARATTTLPRSSSRASGLPYLAGLLTPEDLENGPESAISHPLVFILPRLRHIPDATEKDPPDFVYPATNTETFCYIENPNALAAALLQRRLRLLSSSTAINPLFNQVP